MQNEKESRNELYERLLREADYALNPLSDQLLQQLAGYLPEEVIPVMLNILQEDADKVTGATAIKAIEMIGYPKNKAALPTLIVFLSADINDPRYSAASDTLFHLPPDVLVPDLVGVLLGQEEPYFGETDFFRDLNWPNMVEGICYSLSWKNIDKEYALRCCPTINYLVSQNDPVLEKKLDALLSVIERVALEVEYVIPTLIKLVQQHRGGRYEERIWQILLSFQKEALMPYEPLFEELFP